MPPLSLEEFQFAKSAAKPISEKEVEAIRHSAYENGFQAGAADAVAAAADDHARLSADLVSALQDMSFGFHEASAHIMTNVAPVLRAMVDSVLPRFMSQSVGHTILEAVEPLIADATKQPIQVMISPGDADAVRQVIGESADVPFVIVEDPAMQTGCAHLSAGDSERQIDISGVLDRIGAAVDAVTDMNTRKIANG